MKHSIIKTAIAISFFTIIAAGCATNAPIPEDLTDKQLIQNGQDNFENGKYKMSLRYYNAVLERYPDNIDSCIEAKYEIGHLFMKQGKHKKAKPIFQEIIDLYARSAPGTYPASYEKLSKIEMEKIKD